MACVVGSGNSTSVRVPRPHLTELPLLVLVRRAQVPPEHRVAQPAAVPYAGRQVLLVPGRGEGRGHELPGHLRAAAAARRASAAVHLPEGRVRPR